MITDQTQDMHDHWPGTRHAHTTIDNPPARDRNVALESQLTRGLHANPSLANVREDRIGICKQPGV
jgi:hypothetical protein